MKIGIIGAGDVGGTLGKSWRQRKHEVMFGVRNLQSQNVQRLAKMDKSLRFGDINEAPTNPLTPDLKQLALEDTSVAERIAELAKGAKVVKAFNTIGAKTLNNLTFGSDRADLFICGDDTPSKRVVGELATDIGFDVVDVGSLANARMLENLALLWIELALRQQLGPNIAFKLLRRKADF